MTGAKVGTLALVASAVLLAAACDEDAAEPSAAPTPLMDAVTALPSPPPSPTRTVAESPTPAAPPALLDAVGRWCATDPSEPPDSCFDEKLPASASDDPDGSFEYLPGESYDADPRSYTEADFAIAPNLGECWKLTSHGKTLSGGFWIFCPAGAASGEEWIDDPKTYFAREWGVDTTNLPDFRNQSRLYLGQEENLYPYVKATS